MKRLLPSFLLLIFLSPNPILAETITVSGDVSGIWSADTVLVVGELRIPNDSTLFIDSGVKVIFQGHYKLVVDTLATLLAVGTEQDSILFTAADTSEGWHGIRLIHASDSSRLDYCHLIFAKAAGEGADAKGGAIFCDHTNVYVLNSSIEHCSAERGGAIYCYYSDAYIEDNKIEYNDAVYSGGAINCAGASPSIINNLIRWNSVEMGTGGGIHCDGSSPSVDDNSIVWNSAGSFGGGICCISGSNPNINSNFLSSNTAEYGGGIAYWYSEPVITGNTISNNIANTGGGGIYCYGGWNSTITENIISNNSGGHFGGGILCGAESDPVISSNTITGNTAGDGGGINFLSAIIELRDNVISGNFAVRDYVLNNGYGGGICCDVNSSGTVDNNDISMNTADKGGGGLACFRSDIEITRNEILNNTVIGSSGSGSGGGIYAYDSDSYIYDNIISENIGSAGMGGGLCYCVGSPTISHNIITFNQCNKGGGMSFSYDTFPVINNNTISGNAAVGTSQQGGGIYFYHSTNSVLVNNIIWENGTNEIFKYSSSAILEIIYCDIQDTLWPGTGNISADPMFVDPITGDFNLQWGSPCIDAGDPSFPLDPDSTRVDMGALYFDQSVAPVMDIVSQQVIDILLLDNFPNPFNSNTRVTFALPEACEVTLKMYDTAGCIVRMPIACRYFEAGQHEFPFHGSDLASGIYLIRMSANARQSAKTYESCAKVVLLK